jgi:hypothetical protein
LFHHGLEEITGDAGVVARAVEASIQLDGCVDEHID